LLAVLFASPWFTVPAFANPAKQRAPADAVSAAAEKALSAQASANQTGPSVAGNSTIVQGQTTLGDPVFNRPIVDCSNLSDVGSAVHYHAQAFSVDASGDYAITSVQDNAGTPWDGFIFVFSTPFDPSDPLASCVAASDDDIGMGNSRIEPIALQADAGYVLVTTGFGNNDVGSYANVIAGPGQVQLLATDLSVAVSGPSEVPLQGIVDYTVTVSHVAAAPLDVLVEMSYPSHLSFASSTCGGGLAGPGLWSATISALPAGAANARQCVVSLRVNSAQCTATAIEAFASSAGQVAVNAAMNNVIELVDDPGFEATDATSLDSPAWVEASSNSTANSPLCDSACGSGAGSGPRGGQFWAWFGGFNALEVATLEQGVTITDDASTLRFFTEYPVCDTGSGASEFLRLTIDGTEVWRVDATSPRCNTVGYEEETVSLAAFADGQAHTLRFESTTGTAGAITNFFVDDISIGDPQCAAPIGISNPPQEVPFANRWTLALLALLLAASALALARRWNAA
jgi:hypothetical protein